MVTVARTPEIDRTCDGAVKAALDEFASQLTGGGAARHVVVTGIGPRDLANSDVFILAARVGADGIDATARRALAAWSRSKFLAGKVAFCFLVGDRPADFGPQYDVVADALSGCGATFFAPALTVVNGQIDHQLAVDCFCLHWAPVLPALRHAAAAGTRERVAA